MSALNKQREYEGRPMAYNDEAFFSIANKHGIHHNAVVLSFKIEVQINW